MSENPFESPQSKAELVKDEQEPTAKRTSNYGFWWIATGTVWLVMAGNYLSIFWSAPEFQSFFWYGAAFALLAIGHFWLGMVGPIVKRK